MNEKVLLVDDDEAIREVLSLSIADLGYDVETAAGGRESHAQNDQSRCRHSPNLALANHLAKADFAGAIVKLGLMQSLRS